MTPSPGQSITTGKPDPAILAEVLASTSARRLATILWLSSLTATIPATGAAAK